MSLLIIGEQLSIYVGILLIIIGIIGNGINILVFSSVKTYRKNPTAFYFLITSIFNILDILINLISHVIISGFGIDITSKSLAFCKIRPFCLSTLCLISLNCCCLATINKFFNTSQSVYIRSLSHIKLSYRIVSIVIIVWCIHGIPFLIYYDISPITHLCINTNSIFRIYFPFIYILTLNCIVPVVILLIFSYLAYTNIQKTKALVQQQADRQLMKMVLIAIFLVMISYIQYGIYNAYLLFTSQWTKDNDRLLLENFFGTISNLMCYFYFSGTGYMFLLSSSRFRRKTKEKLFFWRTSTQIFPLNKTFPIAVKYTIRENYFK